jgi:tRNA1Val (adenine37-N6)-methyltransferase
MGAGAPVEGAKTILDVGSGTGLIALMLAQRAPEAAITGVEIDHDAWLQSQQNMDQSPWAGRMEMVENDFRLFSQEENRRFDLIVANPPYFINSKLSPEVARSVARHTSLLNYAELIYGALRLLKPDGKLSIILPAQNYNHFSARASDEGLFEVRRLMIYPTPQKPVSRILSVWDLKGEFGLKEEKMVLEVNGRHDFSKEYLSLTSDFYLT